ncbi:MAG: type II toxin-antitoxin system prevent-host-death family antitoxin [Pseudonocardiales bacterium]
MKLTRRRTVAKRRDRPPQVPNLPFTEVIGRAEYAKTPTVITKRGREVAVVMPIEALAYLLARLPRDSRRKSIAETIEERTSQA